MKTPTRKFTAVLVVLLACLSCFGQARIYTRKARLADLPVKTTKVVLSGEALLSSALRTAVISQWRVSAYEFCTAAEYEALKGDSNYYFLYPAAEDTGTAVLVFAKGGVEKSDNLMKEAFEVVRMPIGEEYRHMESFLNIIQAFAMDAMDSDQAGYLGLRYYNRNESRMRQMLKSNPESVTTLEIGPYRISFDSITDALYSFHKR